MRNLLMMPMSERIYDDDGELFVDDHDIPYDDDAYYAATDLCSKLYVGTMLARRMCSQSVIRNVTYVVYADSADAHGETSCQLC